LAETEGWDAVTTRRLAERVEYSQPVLYSHFANKEAILSAVALESFTEFAEVLAAARESASPGTELAAVLTAYLAYATDHPALYEAMFALPSALTFGGSEQTPTELRHAFEQIVTVLQPVSAGRDLAALAELVWSTLHGIADLTRTGRLPAQHQLARVELLQELITR
jgi:AcrR family transcriptional regulator